MVRAPGAASRLSRWRLGAPRPRRVPVIEPGDIESAIQSANAIGDDRLQKNATGFTSPEKYTHGTSAPRTKWFRAGFETGDLRKMKDLFELPYKEL